MPGRRCANRVIAAEHIPIWNTERSALGRMLASSKLAPNHRRSIESELQEVDRALKLSEA